MRAQEQEARLGHAKPILGETIEHVADMIGMPYIRALEVRPDACATFYTEQFRTGAKSARIHGRQAAHVQVCGTTPCMLRGSIRKKQLIDPALQEQKIHPEQFQLAPNEVRHHAFLGRGARRRNARAPA
jgi:NADH-quinone oxidoreductase subunit E